MDGVDIDKLIDGTDLCDLVRRSGVKMTRYGGVYAGACPLCGADERGIERTVIDMPPFSVFEDNGKWRFECGECFAQGDALNYAQRFYALPFCEAIKHLQGGARALALGAISESAANHYEFNNKNSKVVKMKVPSAHDIAKDRENKRKRAFEIYWAARKNDDFLRAYLKFCRINPNDLNGLPECIKFHPCLIHPCKRYALAMLAPFTDVSGKFLAVQRTWLQPDGFGRADFTPDRMMLGAVSGGAIRLYHATNHLIVTVRIEDGLRARQIDPARGVWAVGSPAALPTLILPEATELVTLYIPRGAENEEENAREKTGEKIGQDQERSMIYSQSFRENIVTAWRRQLPQIEIDITDRLTPSVEKTVVENIREEALR